MNEPKLKFHRGNGEKYSLPIKKAIVDVAPLQRGFDLPSSAMKDGKIPVIMSNGIGGYHSIAKHKGPGVITGRSGTIGAVYYSESDYWPHNTTLWVTDFKGNHPKYVYYLYQHINFDRFAAGSGVPTLNRNDVHKYEVLIPCLEEQRKIADFLSTVDEKIALKQKKYDALVKAKKGLLQKIFSQEIRFKKDDGGEYPEWKNTELGNILQIYHGKDYKGQKPGNIPVLGTGGIITYVSDYLCDWPCVLIGRKGTIDKPQFMDCPFWSVDTLFYSKPKEMNNPKFQYYMFWTINWKAYNEASGVPSLSASTIEKINVLVPCHEEQQKIADFLSVFDEKIETVGKELEGWKTIKKGLLQQMFC